MSEVGKQLAFILQIFLIAYLAAFIAARNGFFRLPPTPRPVPSFYLFKVVSAFTLYLVSQIVIFPSVLVIIFGAERAADLFRNDPYASGLITILGVFFAAGVVFFFLFCCDQPTRRAVFGISQHRFRDWLLGVTTWFVAYPFALGIGQIVALLIALIFAPPELDQVAVKEVKKSLDYPELAVGMISLVVLVVPFVEEILFRGLLQTFLTKYFNRLASIVCASVIFALFHYSSSQGFSNFELLISLFVLSCFLGFIYERQQSLWASVGLHMAFNAVSASMILFG